MKVCGWILAAVLASLSAASALAQQPAPAAGDFPKGRISGQVFGDFYYNVSGDPQHRYNSAGADSGRANIDGVNLIGKDLNGFQIRRVYLQADNDLSEEFSTRFRLEVDGKSLTSDGKIGVNVKAAYIVAKDVFPRGNFFFGMIPTPTWEISEEFWQYRAAEKTIADFRGLGSAADLGVALKGWAGEAHRIGYSVMIGNGMGQRPEDNRYKRLYLSIPLAPAAGFKIEPYVDYEAAHGGADRATFKLFAGYELKRGAVGLEIVDRVNHSTTAANQEPFGISAFGRVAWTDRFALFWRHDRWQPNTRAADRLDSELYIAGLDWQPSKDIHVMPNLEETQYVAKGTGVAPPHHDLQARVTFYYKFSRP